MKEILFLLCFYICCHIAACDHYDLDYEISLEDRTWTPVLVGEPNILISK